ncbi:bifunctional methylenetetrahydrofolate dehydrogenase/methenyltetrahydrofolate cyclohydrolase FolD [Faecalicoccus pleomorphus]|uniref:bifunctional methylenetetrahydrofolate dehydrogenase/methenyltetrahydrofolate cyclohydrolase FolD n=2 Tax=Faecalicoccus pleomorphus TaxID=1323 RepID=UPI001430ADD9|nr:bifunctional methylenetetrahydrofolate dehydrogenase/methenyltetrahydrofolate cyclohydrolase FolD [Faecalicoccus pleomorphus]MBM6677841.1 bifunctional methylenetetrahydrofolate dehydrogenase/methenyltetrahydrofolate cyclohydrolase FolD [Faecalicoccus pleomorphus]MBM6765012.1 bifunctional methylenetetrahydrofolate dehydrogenase/methenyltetrahydrofolate cyclohydrolase FolD [Faecalicoccus pleomorphus]NJE39908.1 bifunctional methylenetetrahydrofolate dehydrogenase/methenyltetrahydrofolate cyclohy
MMEIIYGSELSQKIKAELKQEIKKLQKEGKRLPVLSVILVGDNPASQSYVKSKANACASIGMENRTICMPGSTTQQELLEEVQRQNEDPEVDGILVQLPLPSHLDEVSVIDAISPDKDVDGLHPVNAGKLLTGRDGFVPCTPLGVMEMLTSIGYADLSGLNAVVIGRSNLVGKPLSLLLQKQNATVTMAHSRTAHLKEICQQADILIAAIGKPKKITADYIKEGAVVIDVGINRMEDGKLCGDVDFEAIKEKTKAITPVPKGVGPMTVCMLLKNTLKAYKEHEKIYG